MYDAIFFTAMPGNRPIGPYRLRTALEAVGYSVKVINIDYFSNFIASIHSLTEI